MNKSYLIKNKNWSERLSSSSGGVFISLATHIISNGGGVCAVKFNNDFTSTEYDFITSIDDIKPLMGSKYLDTKPISQEIIKNINNYLNNNKKVLFVGRPCQIYGIKNKINHPNLYCVEISCFGVPIDETWINYKNKIEKEHNSNIISVQFRNKIYGWNNYAVRIVFDNGDIILDEHLNNSYIKEYLSKKHLKSKCLNCKFDRGISTCSDLQIGDAWGVKRIIDDDNMGTSICISYTNKGDDLLNSINKYCEINTISELKLDILKKYNRGLR